jgi:hypothetical protein
MVGGEILSALKAAAAATKKRIPLPLCAQHLGSTIFTL